MNPFLRLLVFFLAFCAGGARAQTASSEAASGGLTGQILYQLLLGEIAAQRGQFGLAASAYLDLARNTQDVRVAKRAAELAFHSRQYEVALQATKLWSGLDPESLQARQMTSSLLLATGRIDELADSMARDLAAEGPRIGEALLRLGAILSRLGDKDLVARLVERVTQPYAGLAEARFVRAQTLAGRDNTRALAEIEQALSLRPDWEQAVLVRASLLPRGAAQLDYLKTALAAQPAMRDVRLAYARTLVGEKRFAESRAEFRRLLDGSPEQPELLYAAGILALQLNDLADAEALLQRLVDGGRGELDAARYYLAQIAEQARRDEDALRRYRAVSGGEHWVPARLRAAQILRRQGRLDDARASLAAAREENPAEALRLRVAEAQLLHESGRNDDAYALLAAALDDNAEDPDLLYETALAADRIGREDVAERHLRLVMRLKPERAAAYNALGYLLVERNIRLDEAGELIDKALALSPGDPFILDSKGWWLFRRGQHAEALGLLQQAYAQRPDPEIAAHVGEVMWVLGRRDEARAIWGESVKANPGNDVLKATIQRLTR